jgi:hypothetical protein
MSRRVALLPGLAYRSGILEKQSRLQFRISDCELRIVRRAPSPVPFSVAGYRERFLFGSVKPKKRNGRGRPFYILVVEAKGYSISRQAPGRRNWRRPIFIVEPRKSWRYDGVNPLLRLPSVRQQFCIGISSPE